MVTSRAVVGSSAIIISGLVISAMAIMILWSIPPLIWCGYSLYRFSGSGMWTSFNVWIILSRASASSHGICAFATSISCWPTVQRGSNDDIGSWKIMLIRMPRILRYSLPGSPTSSRPSKSMLPSIRAGGTFTNPSIEWAVTLFPQPDSPTKARTSSRSRWRLISSTARTMPSGGAEVGFQVRHSKDAFGCCCHTFSTVLYGSTASLRASPTKLKESTAIIMKYPGHHQPGVSLKLA